MKIIWNASLRNCPIKSQSLTAHVINTMVVWGRIHDLVPPDKYQPEFASINIACPSSALPTLIIPSSTICKADIAMPVTSKILFILPAPKWTQIIHWIKFAGDQVEVTGKGVVEHSQQVLHIYWSALTSNLYLSFIIDNTDIDFLSPHLPTSPPISPVLNVDLVSVDTEMTTACERPPNMLTIRHLSILISQVIWLKVLTKELLISYNSLLLS